MASTHEKSYYTHRSCDTQGLNLVCLLVKEATTLAPSLSLEIAEQPTQMLNIPSWHVTLVKSSCLAVSAYNIPHVEISSTHLQHDLECFSPTLSNGSKDVGPISGAYPASTHTSAFRIEAKHISLLVLSVSTSC